MALRTSLLFVTLNVEAVEPDSPIHDRYAALHDRVRESVGLGVQHMRDRCTVGNRPHRGETRGSCVCSVPVELFASTTPSPSISERITVSSILGSVWSSSSISRASPSREGIRCPTTNSSVKRPLPDAHHAEQPQEKFA